MLLTVTTTHQPATDLGYLLHKHPDRLHTRDLAFGVGQVCFPEATAERCTVALLVEVDPVALVRGRTGGHAKDQALAGYVNDRPYAASSMLASAVNGLFRSALGGRTRERPELADTAIALSAHLPVVPVRGGEALLRSLLEPLGYEVTASPLPLDPAFPRWGDSHYLDIVLSGTVRLRDLLEHLVVLLPVLDDDKHHWVGDDEVDKLLRRGGEWLAGHPQRQLIVRRYLRHDRRLAADALGRLLADDVADVGALEQAGVRHDEEEEAVERPLSLDRSRLAAVVEQVQAAGARRVVDLGCGEGKLVARLLKETQVEHVLGVDVSQRALVRAARRLRLDTMPPRQRERVELVQGALTYRDGRLRGFDVATVVEVVEHLDPPRLGAFERALFGYARPATVVLTTPNVEYNATFAGLPAGSLRHRDHRFEWTRAELGAWAGAVAGRHGYQVELAGIGPAHPELGPPTQMAVFRR